MKKLILLILVMVSTTMTACREEAPDIPPSLFIKAVYPDGRPYPYAQVDLYDSQYNYENQTYPVVSGETDRNGMMEIVDLYDIVYYFEVYDNERGYDNYYRGAVYSTGYPLQYNSSMMFTVKLLPK